MDRLILSFFAFFLLFVSKFFYSLNYCMTSFHLRYVFDQHFDFNERNFNCLLVLSTECVCELWVCVCFHRTFYLHQVIYLFLSHYNQSTMCQNRHENYFRWMVLCSFPRCAQTQVDDEEWKKNKTNCSNVGSIFVMQINNWNLKWNEFNVNELCAHEMCACVRYVWHGWCFHSIISSRSTL